MRNKCTLVVFLLLMMAIFLVSCTDEKKEKTNVNNEISIEESEKLISDKEVLPVGTIVLLKEGNTKLMITGHLQFKLNDKKNLYDYCAVLYPEGQLDTKAAYLFNNEKIKRVYFLGYCDQKHRELTIKIKNIKKERIK